uniref:Uncharacterized protein LOC111134258 n=1 Tax=Crassostrea virginica TaxID=6565 RepID=A0A8B8EGT7_CRAVI|nr:uncharacterized protein LOC111134258 [Crassostrea virginica]XP_022338856.1 uncharacterized protein LOC111134258 [Crassostrea virginica]XP_022338857.1 uncharacterized protein LOC111134258 [Crassostrea virginica]
MDLLWKYLSVLILLELALITYVVLNVSKTSMVGSAESREKKSLLAANRRKYDESPDGKNLSDLREKSSSTEGRFYLSRKVYSSHDVPIKRKENVLVHYKKLKRNLRSTNLSTGIPLERKSNQSGVSENFSTTANNVTVPFKHSKQITACMFFFDQKSLHEAQKNLFLLKSYLFYINLSIKDGMDTPYNLPSQIDMLFHWHYVLESEKFLLQLPVDFDLLTFFLLYLDAEERVLNIELLYNNSNCLPNIREDIDSIRELLWNELFRNSTSFYLCNRDIRNDIGGHDILYYITTIWVGYDFNCSKMNGDYGKEIQISKHELPLVTPVFCYILSLHFVWIFALLDVYMHKPPNYTEKDSSFSYANDDRPYGAKRIMKKILYGSRCCCTCCCSGSRCTRCCTCCCSGSRCTRCCTCCCHGKRKPVIRLLGLLWSCVLLFFGFYRTFARYCLSQKFYHDYLMVIKPSEPLFYFWTKSENLCLMLDVLYATICPLLFVYFGAELYDIFFTDDLCGEKTCLRVKDWFKGHLCQKNSSNTELKLLIFDEVDQENYQSCPEQKYHKNVIIDNGKGENSKYLIDTKFSDKLSKPCGTLSSLIPCKHSTSSKSKDEHGCCSTFCIVLYYCLKCPIIFISAFLCCLFPIIPFSCQAYSVCKDCSDFSVENCFKAGKCECKRNCACCTLTADDKFTSFKCIFVDCKCQSIFVKIVVCTVLRLFWALCLFLLLYVLCLRPVISTFTFIFRSFTYFVFVALPLRSNLLQYTLTIGTTLVYFVKYLSEIINMNADILKYIFELKKEKKLTKEIVTEEKIDEETFDYVYEKLTFVTKRLYLLCLLKLVFPIYWNFFSWPLVHMRFHFS